MPRIKHSRCQVGTLKVCTLRVGGPAYPRSRAIVNTLNPKPLRVWALKPKVADPEDTKANSLIEHLSSIILGVTMVPNRLRLYPPFGYSIIYIYVYVLFLSRFNYQKITIHLVSLIRDCGGQAHKPPRRIHISQDTAVGYIHRACLK